MHFNLDCADTNEASSELKQRIERYQVCRHRSSRNELRADSLFDGEGCDFFEAGSINVTLETERLFYEKIVFRIGQ